MPKTILVPLSGSSNDKMALDTAYCAAELFGSHIHGLFARPDPRNVLAQSVSLDAGVSVITSELWDTIIADENTLRKAARLTFDEFCSRKAVAQTDAANVSNRVTAAWQEVTGNVVHQIVRHACIREMTVLSCVDSALLPGEIGEILMHSGRPVLIGSRTVPNQLAHTVAIAWKETAEAARALTASMPFLAKATKVIVLSADEGANTVDVTIESAERLVQSLRWNGIEAVLRRIVPGPRNLSEELMSAALDEGCDLMVMGAYSHSRVRELVFGGVTRHVLTDAKLPILLSH